jgi:RNA polymerase sigma-70 factor (ECF subfamily)
MEANLSENHLVLEQYNVQTCSFNEEVENITVDNLIADNLSPDELFHRRQDFDREAMPHIKLLFKYALKISPNPSDAEILFRDTYFKAFRYFHKFDKGTDCKIWLGRIMRNCFINKYMKDKTNIDS